MASEEPSPEEPLAPPDDMSDVPVVTSDAGDTENTVAMKERPGDPKDQTSSQASSQGRPGANPPRIKHLPKNRQLPRIRPPRRSKRSPRIRLPPKNNPLPQSRPSPRDKRPPRIKHLSKNRQFPRIRPPRAASPRAGRSPRIKHPPKSNRLPQVRSPPWSKRPPRIKHFPKNRQFPRIRPPPQEQSPPPDQASPQTAPQSQAFSQGPPESGLPPRAIASPRSGPLPRANGLSPQNQAFSQEQTVPPNQASSQEQSPPPEQASPPGQTAPQNQASSPEQSPPPEQASPPEQTVPQDQVSPQEQAAPQEQVSPPKQLASKNQAVPQEQTAAQELIGSPELIASKESHPDLLAQGADYPHVEELTRPSGPDQFMENPGEFSASLEGQGWVFRSDLSTPGGWRFLNRERRENSSRFNFLFSEEGNWNLVFDRQDLADGGIERRVRKVHVGGGEAIDILEEQESIFPEVMAENNVEQNEVNSQPAALSGQYLEALKRWETEAEDPTEVGVRAREAIVREAAKNGTTALLAAWLPRYLEDGADPEVLALSLKTLDDTDGYEDGVISILEELLRFESHGQGDEWLYRLASYLEKPGERRDLSRAVKLYQKLVESWPFSKWRESAEERLIWLNRHYFRLR